MSGFYDKYTNPEQILRKIVKGSHFELPFKKKFHKKLPLPYFKFIQERVCNFEMNKIKTRTAQFFLTHVKN